jgi:ribosomal-protein-alanine N-acetyltransferase
MRLDTPRTIVRSWTPADIPAYARIVADPQVMRFIADGSVHTYAQAEVVVRTMMRAERERGWAQWAVDDKASGALMGFCGFGILDGKIDFGYRFARQFWGRGLGTEVARTVLDYGVNTYGLSNTTAMAFVENTASIRILEKIGFVFEQHSRRYGRKVAHYTYSPEPA